MASAPVLGGTKKVTLDDAAFGAEFHEPLVHESVRAELAARRQGTHATKTRGKVRGGGAKPWRQKGTGRARAGSSRSPLWLGGGTVFGPQPRHYTFKVNRKERRAALRSALSLHAGRGSLAVFDTAPFADAPSTKEAAKLVTGWEQPPGVLVVLTSDEERVALSFRNIERASVLPVEAIGVADLVRASAVLTSQTALDALTARAKGEKADEA
jgi:large subunit ribosomal protein L4